MKARKYALYITIAVLALLGIVTGMLYLRESLTTGVYRERRNQLEELTAQLSSSFENALDFNRACAVSAANIAKSDSYPATKDLIDELQWLDDYFDVNSDESFFIMVDSDGRCYSKDGEKGIWGDFDNIVDAAEIHTFIADSINFEGVYWAFAKRLSEPIIPEDGSVTITHVILMKPIEALAKNYTSEAYKDVCETYLLNLNGTRMYDSVAPEDTISAYNIYKLLRGCDSPDGGSFDELLGRIESDGVACDNYVINGSTYYISIAEIKEYSTSILFLIPAASVAENTLSLVSGITRTFVLAGVIVILLATAIVLSLASLNSTRKITLQREENLRKMTEINAELEKSNIALDKARKASEDALVVAQTANSAKSSFLSNMSHDIRTPLNAIVGFTTLLKRHAGDEERVLETAGKIESASDLLVSLINNVLDMSRIESGKTTLHFEPFPLDEMISEIVTVIGEQANQRHQNFKVIKQFPADIVVQGDRLRLNQILMNLLSNAVKYTPDNGNIMLEVRINGQWTPGRTANFVFVVTDNGIGIGKDFIDKVFEPFSRAQESVVNTIQGTGLGLAITKSLVELLGGVISVKSELGKGSVFAADIPLQTVDESTSGGSEEKESEIPEDILQGKHFLVAEDNDINAEIIYELLNLEGATCDIAKNGKEAAEKFESSAEGTYTAVLMDIQMPIMNGYGAARQIRASSHPEAKTIPIAAMTANAFTEDVSEAFAAGMNAHITKPIDMDKVKAFVASISEEDNI